MSIFKGMATAIVTPFHKNGNIDFSSYEKLLNFQLEQGISAIVACGTTGEASTLNAKEHLSVIDFTVQFVQKRIPVIAGTGSNDTAFACYLSEEAQYLGADGLLINTPYYNKTSQKGLISHYREIATCVDLPIIIYNVPGRTGLNMLPETVLAISDEIDQVVGVKEASGNILQSLEIIKNRKRPLDVYSGSDEYNFSIISMGGSGAISVLSNIIPKDCEKMYQYLCTGAIDESLHLQLKAHDLIKALFSDVSPVPVKVALEYMGMIEHYCRLPLIQMEEDKKQYLLKEMKQYGLLGVKI